MAALRRFLRSVHLITAELGVLLAAAVMIALVPQDGADPVASARFFRDHPGLAPVVRTLGFDRVLRSGWFLAVVGLSAVTLWLVVQGQWARARILLGRPLSPESFRGAPFLREWVRPATASSRLPAATLRSSGRAGLLGLPLFHSGLLGIVLAGFIALLFRAEASVDLFEGETLPAATPAAYGRQSPGLLGRSFSLPCSLTLAKLSPERYRSGAVRGIAARVLLGEECGGGERAIAINSPLGAGAGTLYLTNMHGPAAFVQTDIDGRPDRQAALLRDDGNESSTALLTLPGGLEARLRAGLAEDGALPRQVDFRILRGGGLLFAGLLEAGQAVSLPGGATVALVGIAYWARFAGSSDPSLWIAYAGFLACIAGVLLAVCLVRVDTAVVVTPVDGGERVWVAMRPARFVPLYAERFERLVKSLGGPGAPA